jgi:hypothetical protein
MWIFANNAFVSIVEFRDEPDMLLIRARLPGDIQAMFPDAEVLEYTETDYRFRAKLHRQEVAETVFAQVMSVDYGNFKSSVKDTFRHNVYMEVGGVMTDAQEWIRNGG